MTTKREQLLAGIKTLLLANPQTNAGNNVYRDREKPIVRAALTAPTISIIKKTDSPQHNVVGFTDWSLIVEFKVSAAGADPDSQTEATLEQIHDKLFTDRTQGGVAFDTLVYGTWQWQQDEKVKKVSTATAQYLFRYRTQDASLTN